MDAHIRLARLKYAAFLEAKINTDLGFYFWKRYIAAAFWSQLSMPINLSITLITALTTAQANTSNMMPTGIYQNLSIVVLVITVINTFFRPHDNMTKNAEIMKAWNALGIQFEQFYYDDLVTEDSSLEAIEANINQYKQIQEKINDLRGKEGLEMTNFLTDMVHLVAAKTCLKRYGRWLDMEEGESGQEQAQAHTTVTVTAVEPLLPAAAAAENP
jgi:hypothetical protein